MPRNPFTWRSTRPGIARPVRAARQADGDDAPVLDLDVTSHERPVHDGGGDTELHGPRLRRAAG